MIGVFCLLMVLPSGVTRLASTDTADRAGLRGTVSVLPIGGPSATRAPQVQVWRPPGPDSADIPVLYFLPGDPGPARDPFTAGLAQTLNQRLRAGYPPFVVVSVDGNGQRHQDTERANASDGSDLVLDLVTDAAIPAVEGTHMRDAAHRAIAGFSMGGYGTVNIAMQDPGVFGQVVSIAGYFGVQAAVRVQPGAHPWADAMTALRQAFAFLTAGWRQAAADDAGGSGFWAAVESGKPLRPPAVGGRVRQAALDGPR